VLSRRCRKSNLSFARYGDTSDVGFWHGQTLPYLPYLPYFDDIFFAVGPQERYRIPLLTLFRRYQRRVRWLC
jgi:hypothetical protein